MPTCTINDATFHYEERGNGAALVLLHGFPLDSRMWEGQLAELSSRFRVIAPNLRGFGKSSPASAFSMDSSADDIHALLGKLNALPCVLAGLSMGGYAALSYVLRYASDLRGLILIDTRAEADTPQGKENRQKMIESVRASGSKAIADQMEPKMLAPDTLSHRPEQVRALRQIMEACPPTTIEYALSAMRDRPDRTDDLTSVKTPTLILVGDADAITPPAMAQTMHEKIGGSKLVVIQGAGHMSPMEQPAQVNRAIRNFAEALPQ
ncbi:MAG TPA: alpha/beta hydrolase [Humisphaera sp.]|jgi:pimeloyl-ACP methyl ester carboxylesterase|nr:alpha/beta hydrolase [Humisphaera sp.]